MTNPLAECSHWVFKEIPPVGTTNMEDYMECISDVGIIVEDDIAILWLILTGAVAFLMQAGFMLLEAGCVSELNVQTVMIKNILDASVGVNVWWICGWAFAFGDDDDGPFIGGAGFFGNVDPASFHVWFFQWTFASTAATIVSGSVVGRMTIRSYMLYSAAMTGFIYPVVAHWVWDGQGFMNAFNDDAMFPTIDYAGSGVVHLAGGAVAAVGAWLVGPRPGRFCGELKGVRKAHNIPFQLVGTLLLWFGWYGFNCGSTLAVNGAMIVASRVAVNTSLGAGSAGVTIAFYERFVTGRWNISRTCNGILAGLVGITANCHVIGLYSALIIGITSVFLYIAASRLLEILKIDDPLDASAIHGACGIYGIICSGIFYEPAFLELAYPGCKLNEMDGGTILLNQIMNVLIITAWTVCLSGGFFFALKQTIGIRSAFNADLELHGQDMGEFGGLAYNVAKEEDVRNSGQVKLVEAVKPKVTSMEDDSLSTAN